MEREPAPASDSPVAPDPVPNPTVPNPTVPNPDVPGGDVPGGDRSGPAEPAEGDRTFELAPPRHPVAQAAKRWWAARAILGWAFAALYTVVMPTLLSLLFTLSPWWTIGGALLTIALATAHVLVMPRLRYATHRWEVSDTAVYTLAGWIKWQWRIAPLERIETVEMTSGPLQHRYGLASVYVSTASSAGRVEIVGLELDQARRLSDELTARTRELRGATA